MRFREAVGRIPSINSSYWQRLGGIICTLRGMDRYLPRRKEARRQYEHRAEKGARQRADKHFEEALRLAAQQDTIITRITQNIL